MDAWADAAPARLPSGPLAPDGWGDWRGALCVESGRQALSLVARWCRAHAITTVLVPAFHCETMVLPFWMEALSVRVVPVDERLRPDPAALLEELDAASGPVAVLVCRVGGVELSAGLVAMLGRAHAHGHLLVEDATHAILEDLAAGRPAPGWADMRLASLRKLIPVADGAFVAARPGLDLGEPGSRSGVDRAVARTGERLLRTVNAWVPRTPLPAAGQNPPVQAARLVRALAEADEALEKATEPAWPSPATVRRLARLDAVRLASRWRAANATLAALLPRSARVLNPGLACFPLLRTPAAAAVDEALAAHGVFAPQFWPRPAWLAPGTGWPQDVVSVDVAPGRSAQRPRALARIIDRVLAGGPATRRPR